jgi:hypothetical protein
MQIRGIDHLLLERRILDRLGKLPDERDQSRFHPSDRPPRHRKEVQERS